MGQLLCEVLLLAHPSSQRLGRIVNACDFTTNCGGRDGERRQAPVHAHPATRVGAALSEGRVDHPKALVECEPRRPGMSGQHILLLDCRVDAEAECGVPGHLDRNFARPTDATGPSLLWLGDQPPESKARQGHAE